MPVRAEEMKRTQRGATDELSAYRALSEPAATHL
jgi:hypothetical protein